MVTMQQIYDEYHKAGIRLFQWTTPCEAATVELDGRYNVFIDFFRCTSLAEQKWKLGHEYGHCATGTTHKLYSPFQLKMQHEFKANKKAALTFLPPQDFRAALDRGITEPWELAEWFDVPQEQIEKIWSYYSKNGLL